MACENDVRVQNEHAVRCSIVSKPVHVLDYVKAISALVGASHILAVFEENDFIKVFFDDKRCVDTVMRNCLHVLGHHVNVDYVMPPGVKLILSNVDPVITNYDIMRLLSAYGTVVSPVIRPPVSDDIELCHISYGVRFVYLVLSGCIPEKIEFRYGDQLSSFQVNVVENTDTSMIPRIKTDILSENQDEMESSSIVRSYNSLPEPASNETLSITEIADPVLVNVQSVPHVASSELVESLNPEVTDSASVLKLSPSQENTQSQVGMLLERRRGRPRLAKHKRLVSASNAAKRIKNAKRKWLSGYKRSNYKGRALKKQRYRNFDMPDLIKVSDLNNSVEGDDTPKVLGNTDLLKFIDEVKRHRAPLELARKFIGPNCDSEKIYSLINQLHNFKKSQNNINLKSRIWRLIKTLTDALNSENKSK